MTSSTKQIIKTVSFITVVTFILTNAIYAATGSNMLRPPMVCGRPAPHKEGKDPRFNFELEDIMRNELLESGQFRDIIDFNDLLVSSIRISMYKEMLRLDVPEKRAREIAKGVIRSLGDEDYEMMAAIALLEKDGECAITGKVGGTSFKFAILNRNGEFIFMGKKREWKDKEVLGKAPTKDNGITAEQIADKLVESIIEAIEAHQRSLKHKGVVKKIVVSIPAQTEDINGGWGRIASYDEVTPNINLCDTELARLIEERLAYRGYKDMQVILRNDCFCRLEGELSEKGTLGRNGFNSGTVVISGTGANASIAVRGKSVTYEGALIELGNTVRAPIGFNPLKDTFINDAFKLKGKYPKDDYLIRQGLQRAEVLINGAGLSSLAELFGFSTHGDAETAARERDEKALKFIELYGFTVGKYLACLVAETYGKYKGYKQPWADHIVLVSGVFENFAKGIGVSPQNIIVQRSKNTTLASNAEGRRLLERLQKALDSSSARYKFIIKRHTKHFNYPYPSGEIEIEQKEPIEIRTPFKCLTLGPKFLDTGQKRIAMVVQVEGGTMFGEEVPCSELILILEKNPSSGRYEERYKYQLGQDSSDWVMVENFKVTGENTIKITSKTSSRYTTGVSSQTIETYRIKEVGITCIKTQTKPVLYSNSQVKKGL